MVENSLGRMHGSYLHKGLVGWTTYEVVHLMAEEGMAVSTSSLCPAIKLCGAGRVGVSVCGPMQRRRA